ncbi:ATP-utilizing phosphoenolpyruvate carboxykinase [Chytridium lagenaria]|nr:ATP-utilizing phosphoenolpyruvate carboxykinase [Chytridium lagenaria]
MTDLSANETIHHDDIHEVLYTIAHFDYSKPIIRNGKSPSSSIPVLYEEALAHEKGTAITSQGALALDSGLKKGRSPKDKRIVDEPASTADIWGVPSTSKCKKTPSWSTRLYVFDGFAGWDPKYRIKVRVICARAYHALFMRNMLIRPTDEELAAFGEPDFTIFNAGEFPANRFTNGMSSTTSVSVNFARKEMVILGTQYAGEMKKGIFTVMHYLMPKAGVLSLHSSANEGPLGDVSLFFGLSGTGKTTLSADPHRFLIGDDEHCWSDNGIFNIEGGCYAKCIDLSPEKEPEIFKAIRFGSVVENVAYDDATRAVDFADGTKTENTRCAYPIEFIPNAKIPCLGGHPKNIILLTCDAFGVLPPVSKLTPDQAPKTGSLNPKPPFPLVFGAPFLVWHPTKYATMLAEKMAHHKASAWLINTGWTGGAYGSGNRISLKYSRAIIDAIHAGELDEGEFDTFPIFHFAIPKTVAGVPAEVLDPRKSWMGTPESFEATLRNWVGCLQRTLRSMRRRLRRL